MILRYAPRRSGLGARGEGGSQVPFPTAPQTKIFLRVERERAAASKNKKNKKEKKMRRVARRASRIERAALYTPDESSYGATEARAPSVEVAPRPAAVDGERRVARRFARRAPEGDAVSREHVPREGGHARRGARDADHFAVLFRRDRRHVPRGFDAFAFDETREVVDDVELSVAARAELARRAADVVATAGHVRALSTKQTANALHARIYFANVERGSDPPPQAMLYERMIHAALRPRPPRTDDSGDSGDSGSESEPDE